MEKLCIKEGEKVWSVSIDIVILNHDGNLIDAATLGAMTSLLNAKMPKVEYDKILRENYEKDLPLNAKTLNVSISKVNGKFLVDTTKEEENVIESKTVVGVRDDGKVVSIQKIGPGFLNESEIYEIIDMAIRKSKDLFKLLKVEDKKDVKKPVKTNGKKDTKPKTKADKSGKDEVGPKMG